MYRDDYIIPCLKKKFSTGISKYLTIAKSQYSVFQPKHKKRASYSQPTQYSVFNQRFRLAGFPFLSTTNT